MVKYPVTLFIFLLIGYSQLFAPLYLGNAPGTPAKKISKSTEGHVPRLRTEEAQTLFIAEEEEENERISFKTHTGDAPALTYTHLREYFLPYAKALAPFAARFARLSFLISPYLLFRVFRL